MSAAVACEKRKITYPPTLTCQSSDMARNTSIVIHTRANHTRAHTNTHTHIHTQTHESQVTHVGFQNPTPEFSNKSNIKTVGHVNLSVLFSNQPYLTRRYRYVTGAVVIVKDTATVSFK